MNVVEGKELENNYRKSRRINKEICNMEKIDGIHSAEVSEESKKVAEQQEPRWLFVCGEKGKYTLSDMDGNPFSFSYRDECITEMYQIETITACDGDDTILGYKYQLTENGQWGFISKGFLQFVYPVYDDIVAIEDGCGMCVAAYHCQNEQVSINISSEFYLGNMVSEHRLVEILDMYGEYPVPNCFKYLPKSQFVPTEHATIERNYLENTGVILYRPDKDGPMAVLNYRGPEGWTQITLYWGKNIILGRKPLGEGIRIPALDFSFASCCNITKAEELDCKVERCVYGSIYIVEKCERYAIASVADYKTLDIQYETPFDFTDIRRLSVGDCFCVEKAGKKGVCKLFCHEENPLIIPCEYEKIEVNAYNNIVCEKNGVAREFSSEDGSLME